MDKLSHLVCHECVRKIENFHCYALMAQKNQELFNIMYSEKIYREHCTALSSLNTTLYREPPTPVVHKPLSLVQPSKLLQQKPVRMICIQYISTCHCSILISFMRGFYIKLSFLHQLQFAQL